jgi:hypothetical protein
MTAAAQCHMAELVNEGPCCPCAVGDHRMDEDMRHPVIGCLVPQAGRPTDTQIRVGRGARTWSKSGRQWLTMAAEPSLARPAEDSVALDGVEGGDGETGDEGIYPSSRPACKPMRRARDDPDRRCTTGPRRGGAASWARTRTGPPVIDGTNAPSRGPISEAPVLVHFIRIGPAGRLRSDQVADINRNARPASPESAIPVADCPVAGTTCASMREQGDQTRQATTAKVCLDLAKSGRFTVPVLSIAGFNRPLLALSTICRCPSRSKERSWPRNRGNLANVG